MKIIKISTIGLMFLLAAFLPLSCSPALNNEKPLTPITVQLAWTHYSQFAGLYAADQNNYYADEGLKVSFIEGGAKVNKIDPIVNGTAQFGITSPDELILARADGKPVKAIATIFRRSPVVFISLANKNITRPIDFTGKTIRTPSNILPSLHAMMAKVEVPAEQYKTVDLPSDLDLFASGDAEVWGVYINGFSIVAEQAGYELNKIYPDDYGVHFYSDTLFTSDTLILTDPDLVLRFLRASLKGWSYAVENSANMPPIVQKYAPDADPALELARMDATAPLVNTGEDHYGWMKAEIWENTEATLRKYSVLTKPVNINDVFTMEFLNDIY